MVIVAVGVVGVLVIGAVVLLRGHTTRLRALAYVQGRMQGELAAARDPEVARRAVELDDMARQFQTSIDIAAATTPSQESDASSLLVRLMCSRAAFYLALRGAATLPAYIEMFPEASVTKAAPKEAVAHFARGTHRFVAALAKEAGRQNPPLSSTETVEFIMDELRRAGISIMNTRDTTGADKECDLICVAPGCTALDAVALSPTQEEDIRLRRAVHICRHHRGAATQDALGIMYVDGTGVQPTDAVKEGLDWLRKATDEANMAAQTVLRLGRKVADEGSTVWRTTLALMYAAGQALPETDAKWLYEAADEGNAEAQTALARMCAAGQGVAQDDAEALKWLRKAVDQDHAPAQALLGSMYYKGCGVVPQDYAEALKWSRKAADQGNADAQTTLGFIYANGYGVPQDYGEALNWTLKAAEQGNPDAQCHLGYLYGTGHGAPQDKTEALKWFRKSAAHGHGEAQAALATMTADEQAARSRPQGRPPRR